MPAERASRSRRGGTGATGSDAGANVGREAAAGLPVTRRPRRSEDRIDGGGTGGSRLHAPRRRSLPSALVKTPVSVPPAVDPVRIRDERNDVVRLFLPPRCGGGLGVGGARRRDHCLRSSSRPLWGRVGVGGAARRDQLLALPPSPPVGEGRGGAGTCAATTAPRFLAPAPVREGSGSGSTRRRDHAVSCGSSSAAPRGGGRGGAGTAPRPRSPPARGRLRSRRRRKHLAPQPSPTGRWEEETEERQAQCDVPPTPTLPHGGEGGRDGGRGRRGATSPPPQPSPTRGEGGRDGGGGRRGATSPHSNPPPRGGGRESREASEPVSGSFPIPAQRVAHGPRATRQPARRRPERAGSVVGPAERHAQQREVAGPARGVRENARAATSGGTATGAAGGSGRGARLGVEGRGGVVTGGVGRLGALPARSRSPADCHRSAQRRSS